MSALWLLIRAWLGRNGLMAGLAAGAAVLALTYDTSRVNHGKALRDAETLKQAGVANAKDFAAHSRARRPGSFERLRRNFCDDCVD